VILNYDREQGIGLPLKNHRESELLALPRESKLPLVCADIFTDGNPLANISRSTHAWQVAGALGTFASKYATFRIAA
jgi:hypothetical protein